MAIRLSKVALQSSQRLGPYEILSAIGAGGMGEVYRARDTRLDRTVAIKVLPTHLADKPDLRERFEREAKTIASLNHPHICTLYDVGHQDGTDYLVMEYLEGETLAERLKKGPLPIDQVLKYAIEISDALDKAHREGITHRDLKPGNILLTKSGAKLLDFGLAKLKQDATPPVSLSQRPTAKSGMTAEGTILGTLQYMAPEQVEGKTNEIDARTDIFAFGAVVYEMATGKKAFDGKTKASLIAKILEVDPPSMVSLQPMTPPALNRVVKTCLAKEADNRWQTASDLGRELKWIAESTSGVAAGVAPVTKTWGRAALWAGAAVIACIIVGLAVWMIKPAPTARVARFVIALPAGQRLWTAITISPDGTRLAYVAGPDYQNRQLYLRAMDGLDAHSIPGTASATDPFFSPDGQWVGFVQGWPLDPPKLMKVPFSGGTPITLYTADTTTGFFGGTWNTQGQIAFSLLKLLPGPGNSTISWYGVIERISDTGGNPQSLTRLEKGESVHYWPDFLPDGRSLLFETVQGTTDIRGAAHNTKIIAQSLRTGERRELVQAGSFPLYAASGHLIYQQGSSLMAAPFDSGRMAITGAAVPVVEGVLPSSVTGDPHFRLSSTGSLVYVPGSATAPQLKLVWVDRKGAEQSLPAPARNYVFPRISPGGQHVAVGIEEADSQIWLYDLARDTLTRLTFEGKTNVDPIWTPDGKRIVFKGNEQRLFWQPADGSGPAEQLTKGELSPNNAPGSFSPDGRVLTFMGEDTSYDLYTLLLKDGKRQPFIISPADETAPRFSPDGHFIAYESNESGRFEIYVRPYPGPGGKYQISTEGGMEPVWNPKGRELFYRSGNKMMAVEVTTQPTFSAGKPKMLFEAPYTPTPRSFPDYDVSPDGQRFLMLEASDQAQPNQIVVVQNWFEELKQKVPPGKK